MKIKKIEVYFCEHCNKLYQRKWSCEKHEELCKKNPDNLRPCFGCSFLCKKEAEIYGDYTDGSEWKRTINLLFCNKKEIYLHTPQNEIKGNDFELGYTENNPMPKKCDLYSNDYSDYIF
jgi:hypothetical protein